MITPTPMRSVSVRHAGPRSAAPLGDDPRRRRTDRDAFARRRRGRSARSPAPAAAPMARSTNDLSVRTTVPTGLAWPADERHHGPAWTIQVGRSARQRRRTEKRADLQASSPRPGARLIETPTTRSPSPARKKRLGDARRRWTRCAGAAAWASNQARAAGEPHRLTSGSPGWLRREDRVERRRRGKAVADSRDTPNDAHHPDWPSAATVNTARGRHQGEAFALSTAPASVAAGAAANDRASPGRRTTAGTSAPRGGSECSPLNASRCSRRRQIAGAPVDPAVGADQPHGVRGAQREPGHASRRRRPAARRARATAAVP